jgi:multidrug resistance efflux pump
MAETRVEDTNAEWLKCLENLQQIRAENLEPAQFWPLYLEALRTICTAEFGTVAVRGLTDEAAWQPIAFSPGPPGTSAQSLHKKLESAAEACEEKEVALLEDESVPWLALRFNMGAVNQLCLALFSFRQDQAPHLGSYIKLLSLLNDLPANYQLSRSSLVERARSEQFSGVLDLMALLNTQARYLSAAMTFCNELASRYGCSRVSLGWYQNGYIKLRAISHVDDFDKKMEAVQGLELAMEEALDQDTEIFIPQADDTTQISRDHTAYARLQQTDHVCSLPLRVGDEPVAVCTLERDDTPFTESDLSLLRLCCDQAAPRLSELNKQDRWFGARLATYLREKAADLIGYQHTWAKVLSILGILGLAFLCFVPLTYRLSSPVILKAETVTFLTAPFDGYIEQVGVRVGDIVSQGDTLLVIDQRDLILKEEEFEAERNRYQREYEKARVEQALADMRIAGARLEQVGARLDLVRHRLGQSVIRAPYAGIVVEGDQIERVGSPVAQGDIMFRVGKTDQIFVELEVAESEIHHVDETLTGEIALVSRPQDVYPIQVQRIEPSAVAQEEGNVFLVRCTLAGDYPAWWKPGMTGMSKLNAGKRTLLWTFTHRTVDFLRLHLWW